MHKRNHQRLMRAIRRYTHAYNVDSWKGGGDPDSIPEIEAELRKARKHLRQVVRETCK